MQCHDFYIILYIIIENIKKKTQYKTCWSDELFKYCSLETAQALCIQSWYWHNH